LACRQGGSGIDGGSDSRILQRNLADSLNCLSHGLRNVLHLRSDDGLLHVLNGFDFLRNVLDGLDLLFDDGGVNDLSFNSLILDSFGDSLLRDVLDVLVLINLGHVLGLILDGVVVGDLLFLGNVLDSLDGFVFDDALLIRNVFDARFSLD